MEDNGYQSSNTGYSIRIPSGWQLSAVFGEVLGNL